jgi:hypothetical protein
MRRLVLVFCAAALLGFVFASNLYAEMSVVITSPHNGDVLAPCGDQLITFQPTVTTETIKEIRVYSNGVYKALVKKEPWQYTWKKLVRGSYTLTVLLRDTDGNEVWSDPVRIKVGPVSAGEKVLNGSFECSTMAPWNLNLSGGSGAIATATVIDEAYFDDNNYLMVEITNPGTEFWHVQLQQSIPVDSGHVYQISFLADADIAKSINVSMQENQGDYRVQFGQDITIDGADLYGPYEFIASRTDPTNFMRFNISASTTTLYIDDIRVVDTSASSVDDKTLDAAGTVKDFALLDAYPNPFNMNTVIPFKLAQSGVVDLSIYNTRGQLIKTVASGLYNEGLHHVSWNGLNEQQQVVPSGVYFYRLTTSSKTNHAVDLSRKIVLVK